MKKREPTREDYAIIKVTQSIRSCNTLDQLTTCKQMIRLLNQNYNIKYLTRKYLNLRYKQQLHNLTKE